MTYTEEEIKNIWIYYIIILVNLKRNLVVNLNVVIAQILNVLLLILATKYLMNVE